MNGLKPHSGGHPATDKLIVPYGAGWAAFWRLSRHLQPSMLRRCYRAGHLESALQRARARPSPSSRTPSSSASHDPVRERNLAHQPRRGDAAVVPRLRDERDRRPRPARCARRPEAGASARAVRDARAEQRLEPALQEERAHRRRRDRQVPPARRHRGVRHHRAHGAGLSPAPHAGRRPGQLRLGRRRQRRGDALHRDPPGEDRARDAGRHRQGHGRLRPQLRRLGEGAAGAAGARAEPAGQRLGRHRGGHGHQHPAAQPERGGRRLPAPAEERAGHASKS